MMLQPPFSPLPPMSRLKRPVLGLFLIMLTSTLLSACSQKPTLSEMQTLVTDARSNTIARVVDVSKINGYWDHDEYVAVVSYQLRFIKDYSDAISTLTPSTNESSLTQTMQNIYQAGVLMTKYGRYQAGDTVRIVEDFLFISTEQGWMIKVDTTN